jgi:hypothetical protein
MQTISSLRPSKDKNKRRDTMISKIPWMKREDQPQFSNDVLPMCFFQLLSIDEAGEESDKNEAIGSKLNPDIDVVNEESNKNKNYFGLPQIL